MPLSSADFTQFTPVVLELSLFQSHFLWGEFSICALCCLVHYIEGFRDIERGTE